MLASIVVILLVTLRVDLLLSESTATGGDMGAHIYPPVFLREELLPGGQTSGWSDGWFAGMPMLHFHFPLVPFLQALLSFSIPQEVAFKIGTVLGTLMLPFAAYALFRLLRFPSPEPILAAIAAAMFLFMDSYAVYGGNIQSSLVGEYSYTFSLALTLLFVGLAHRSVTSSDPKWLLGAAVVLAMAVLGHLVPVILFAPSILLLFIHSIRRGARQAGRFVLMVVLACGLTAFWSVPFIARLPFTPEIRAFALQDASLLIPIEAFPFAIAALGGMLLVLRRRDAAGALIVLPGVAAALLYLTSPNVSIWNGRYLPAFYLTLFLTTAYLFGTVVADRQARNTPTSPRIRIAIAVPLCAALSLVGWVALKTSRGVVDEWVERNYSGYEGTAHFDGFTRLMTEIAALPPGRVFWENSDRYTKFGTSLMPMATPYWTGKPSLQGLFLESSLTAPFVLVTESEVSHLQPNDTPSFSYPGFDFGAGIEHMNLLGVSYFIASSEPATDAANSSEKLERVARVGEFSIFRLDSRDVVVPEYQPVNLGDGDWQAANIEWFSNAANLQIPLVAGGPPDWPSTRSSSQPLPRVALPDGGRSFEAQIESDSISFDTEAIGQPHLVRTTYFPNWRVEGAEGPYLASPSMMVVVPHRQHVTLQYGRTWVEWLGLALTGIAVLAALFILVRRESATA